MRLRANTEDVDYVFDHIWSRHELEAQVTGITNEQLRALAHKVNPSGVLHYNGKPMLFLGLEIKGDEAWTWFICAEGFYQHWRQITADSARIIEIFTANSDVKRLNINAVAVTDKVEHWYSLLGFRRDDSVPVKMGKADAVRFTREV